jgi:hypothetical protein
MSDERSSHRERSSRVMTIDVMARLTPFLQTGQPGVSEEDMTKWIGALIALAALPSPERAVELTVFPTICREPAVVRITATVARDDANRWLTIVADSGEYRRSSTVELDGGEAARTHRILLKGIPAGRYVVTAIVERADGSEELDARDLVVTGRKDIGTNSAADARHRTYAFDTSAGSSFETGTSSASAIFW